VPCVLLWAMWTTVLDWRVHARTGSLVLS
jgi:hypothetical protein